MVVNEGINEKLFQYISKSVRQTPFYQLLGIRLEKIGPGCAELGAIITEAHSNPLGLVHGGLLMALADAAMGNAIRSLGITAVTVDCSTSFIAGAPQGEHIVARGKVLKAGKNMVYARADIWCGERILGESKGSFFKIGNIGADSTSDNTNAGADSISARARNPHPPGN